MREPRTAHKIQSFLTSSAARDTCVAVAHACRHRYATVYQTAQMCFYFSVCLNALQKQKKKQESVTADVNYEFQHESSAILVKWSTATNKQVRQPGS